MVAGMHPHIFQPPCYPLKTICSERAAMLNVLKVSSVNKDMEHYKDNREDLRNSLDFKKMLEMQLALKKTGKKEFLNEKKH